MKSKRIVLMSLLLLSCSVQAGNVSIEYAELVRDANKWRVNVTLRHADTGWEHYADGWRIVDKDGKVLGGRTLYHPHVKEQPFTRSLSAVRIPSDTTVIYIEAHDKVHKWSPERLKIDMNRPQGKRYRIRM